MLFFDVNYNNQTREFKALFNNAAIGIIMTNNNGEIITINDFGIKQFGYSSEELIGQKIEILIPRRFRETHIGHRDRYHGKNAHSRPMGVGMDLFAVKKDGTEFPVEVSLSPYMTEEGQYAIAFISDISIRKESENALLQLNAELEEKVKQRTQSLSEALEKEKELNELKSRFVSMASHEFRTPLSTVLSSAYLLSKYHNTDEQPKRDKHIQRVISSVNMLNDILNDFLSVGKIEEGRIQIRYSDFNLPQFINELTSEMQPIFKNGQHVSYKHTGPEVIHLDSTLLKHIVMNLLSNAVKFSPEGSTIEIVTVNEENKTLLLSIKDSGIGISKEDQEHLFERFFRGANVTNIQGTGLGLHIVAKYTELMNGVISGKSDLGEGTTFTINFNLAHNE
ncbi:MAG: PAS domain S-box protein [Bacteroidetes bacterium]|nr:PAS domain S-box protein [Bacteroidota bacterium]